MIDNRNDNSRRGLPTRSLTQSTTRSSFSSSKTIAPSVNSSPAQVPSPPSAVRANGQMQPQYIIAQSPKSMGIGLILAVLFGPLGLLYSTVKGGVIMIVVGTLVSLIFGALTLGFGLIVILPIIDIICVIWAYYAIKHYNEDLMSGKLMS